MCLLHLLHIFNKCTEDIFILKANTLGLIRLPLIWPVSTTGRCSPVGNMFDCRYMSDCRSRGPEFDPGLVLYFRWDQSWNNSTDSRRVVVSYKRKYVHKVLANHLVKRAQGKSVVSWTDRLDMTIAVDWEVKHQTKPNKWSGSIVFAI